MAYSITLFGSDTTPQLPDLDNTIATVAALGITPCLIAGTNVLTLTPNFATAVPAPTISAYAFHMVFSGVVPATNTGPATAAVGTLPALPILKCTPAGIVPLAGGEMVASNAIVLFYINNNFLLLSSTAVENSPIQPLSVRIAGNSTLTNLLSGSVSVSFTATPGWSSQDKGFTLTGQGAAIPAVGDFIALCPPSLSPAGVGFAAMVTAVGSLSSVLSVASVNIRLLNTASASIAANSGIYRYSATRMTP